MTDFNPVDLTVGILLDADGSRIRSETEKLADIITRDLNRGFERLGDTITRGLTKELRTLGRVFDNTFRNMADNTRETRRAFNLIDSDVDELGESLENLRRRSQAFRDSLSQQGADPNLFATYDDLLDRILRRQTEFNKNFETLASDRGAFVAFARNLSLLERAAADETSGIRQILLNFRQVQEREARLAAQIARDQSKERQQIREFEKSEMVALTQQETTLTNARIRTASNEAIQTSQRTARVRIELLRFTLRQARTLERSIGTIFRTSAAIIAGAFARIENTVFRIGRVFRRSNTDINDGLQGALLRRERTIDRSFDRQTREIRSSVTQQERIIQRFQARASTGLTGAVTGRSGFGALLGGGLAFGGGFLLIDRLRAGFDEAVNLNEALNKTRQIFREASGDIEDFASDSVENLFVTQSAALEAASNFGIFGKAAGLVGDDLATFSKDLTLLATDLASFNNTTIADATTAISAALRGESEPIRRYGVLLNEATLQQRALELGIIDTTRKLQPFERVLAANAEIFAQTVDQQGDAARTADDFANASRRAAAASTETFAAITERLIPFAEAIVNFAFPSLQGLTRFIRNEVGPGLRVLRDGLIGAGAALGALIAAKGAIEVIGFLGTALRLVATPLGLFVTAVAGLGAGINILRRRSASFDVAIQNLVEAVRGALGEALSFAFRQIDRFADFLGRTVIPIVVRFAEFIAENLRTGLDIVSRVFTNIVIPAVQRFGELLRDDVIPFVVDLAEVVGGAILDGLGRVRDLAVSFFETVQPFIQPAIDGFLELADAILGLFIEGDVSGLLDGVIELAKGIGGTFVNIGEAAIDALRPQLERVLGFIEGFFTRDRLLAIAEAFLVVVERIGYILGRIVSDPRFLTALAAIVAAAGVTAFRFVRGFADGVRENLPELARLLGGAFKTAAVEAFRFAFRDRETFIAILGAVFAASALRRVFQAFGRDGARAATASFATNFGRQLQRSPQYLQGLFGGEGAIRRAAARDARRYSDSFQKDLARRSANLRDAGFDLGFTGPLSDRQVDELKRVEARLEGINTKGAVTRGVLRGIKTGFTEVAGGIGDTVRGLSFFQDFEDQGARRIKNGFAKIRSEVGRGFANAREEFRRSGVSAGQAIGAGIIGGVTAYLSGQLAGAGLASGDTTSAVAGIGGIIGGAIIASAVPVVGPALGALTLAVGGLSTALSFNAEKAKKAKEEMLEYALALRTATTDADLLRAATETITLNLLDENQDTILFLDRIQFRTEDFAEAVLNGSTVTRESLDLLARAFGPLGTDFKLFVNDVVQGGGDIEQALKLIADPARIDAIGPRLGLTTTREEVEALRDEFDELGFDTKVLTEALDFLFDERNELAAGAAVAEAARNIAGLNDTVVLGEGHLRDLERAYADVGDGGRTNLGKFEAFGKKVFDAVGREIRDIGSAGADAVTGFDLIGRAIDDLNRVRIDALTDQLDGLQGALGIAQQQAIDARDALFDYFNPDDEVGAGVNRTILSIEGIGRALTEAIGEQDVSPIASAAQIESTLGSFRADIERIAKEFFEENPDFELPELRAEFAPVLAGIDEFEAVQLAAIRTDENLSPDEKAAMEAALKEAVQLQRDTVNALFDDEGFQAAIDRITIADAVVDDVKSQIEAIDAELKVDVVFDDEQVRFALLQAGIEPSFVANLPEGAIAGAQGFGQNPEAFFEALADIPVTAAELTAGQQAAVQRARAEASAGSLLFPTAPTTENNYNFTIEQNISGSEPRETADESVRSFKAAASSGGLVVGRDVF